MKTLFVPAALDANQRPVYAFGKTTPARAVQEVPPTLKGTLYLEGGREVQVVWTLTGHERSVFDRLVAMVAHRIVVELRATEDLES